MYVTISLFRLFYFFLYYKDCVYSSSDVVVMMHGMMHAEKTDVTSSVAWSDSV